MSTINPKAPGELKLSSKKELRLEESLKKRLTPLDLSLYPLSLETVMKRKAYLYPAGFMRRRGADPNWQNVFPFIT